MNTKSLFFNPLFNSNIGTIQIRHAQGIHNLEGEKDPSAYFSPNLFDAHLTPLGWQQVAHLRTHILQSGLLHSIQLVVTSPLLRAMQTAVGVFGAVDELDSNHNNPPLMVANAGNSSSPPISSFNCPPFVATELCREHLSLHPCDWRNTITTYRSLFPAVDFSLIESDEDTLVKPGERETFEQVAARALQFLKWIWTRKEKEIAVVSHGGFLHDMLSLFGNDCHPTLKTEIGTRFANCQLLSIVLVDRGMIGSDPPTADSPVKLADEVIQGARHAEKEETAPA
ncbi:Phosphoglycerate mutase-like protein [Linum grandiflorum]